MDDNAEVMLHGDGLTFHACVQAIAAASVSSKQLSDVLSGVSPSLYIADSAALRAVGAYAWGFWRKETQCMLIQRLAADGTVWTQEPPMNGSVQQYNSPAPTASGVLMRRKIAALT